MREKIEEVIMKKNWSLSDILDMDRSVENVVQEVITDMTTEEKYLLVKDIEYGGPNDITVGQIVSIVVREELTLVAKQIFNSYLKTAQVNFDDKMDKRKTKKPKTVVEDIPETTEDKIMTLKQRIREDSKQLDDKEMREQGMI
tara:strand:+ start:589 stop:1017 length:429 start_codon:yes stop_codon:yes gene_type:complete